MRYSSILLALATLFVLAGCGPKIVGTGTVITKPRTVLAFQTVKATDPLTVNFVQAEEAGVEITADDNLHPYIKTSVKKGVLSISLEEDIKSYTKLQVTVKAPQLKRIEGTGEVALNISEWKQDGLAIFLKESCQARMNIQGDNLKVNGRGDATFGGKGKLKKLNLIASDKAKLDFTDYKISTADVKADDKSVVKVNVKEVLNITASGNAEIIKRGSAKIKRTEISGSATISTP